MEMLLTPHLLGYLIKKKYRYLLTKTTCTNSGNKQVNIKFEPVKKHPLLHMLPEPFNGYRNISHDLLHVCSSTNDAIVTVELTTRELQQSNLETK
jgi:hypothetical protein